MKSHEEIKKGLECALCDEPADLCGEDCPCWSAYSPAEMRQDEHVADALAYIQQLEAENERLQRYYEAEADRAAESHHNMLEAEASVPRWIPVEERLPEDFHDVLVRVVHSKGSRFTAIDARCKGKWIIYPNSNYRTITHWMPLPEPPEVNEK